MRILGQTLMAAALATTLVSGPSRADTIAVTHAHIHTMGKGGEIASGVVLIENGRIAAVGRDVAIPAGARIIDAKGRIVTPGLIDLHAQSQVPSAYQHRLILCRTDQHVIWRGDVLEAAHQPLLDVLRGMQTVTV